MKLEIDLTDRHALIKIKAELTQWLNLIEYALTDQQGPGRPQRAENRINGAEQSFVSHHGTLNARPKPVNPLFEEVLGVVNKLPTNFTTTDVMVAMGTKAKANRGTIKLAIQRLIEADFIRLVEVGRGRKPSSYERLFASLHSQTE